MSDVFGGKVPGLNAPLRFSDAIPDVEKIANRDKLGNPEKLAFGRLEQQKGLSLFGDKDNDKVFNVFDCKPLDRMNQGFFDKVTNLWKGKGWVDKPGQQPPKLDVEKEEASIELGQQPTIVQQDVATVGRGLGAVGGSVAAGARRVGGGLARGGSNVLYAAGVFKTPKEKEALSIRREEERAFRRQAEKEVQLAKIKAMRETKDKTDRSFHSFEQPFSRRARGGVESFESGMGMFRRDLSTAAHRSPMSQTQSVSDLIGLGGGRTGMSSAYELTRTSQSETPFSVKVDELFGKGQIARQWREGRGQTQQAPQTQQTPTPQPAQSQSRYSQEYAGDVRGEGQVYSPLSKKMVKYPRGPYRKRKVVYQQPYQQPV